ncbi:MAG TPA: hypothetical protein VGS19_35345 [Streptosporangiaceae bacterium]|nr:hypothetical protein [Streptosporangiaceae bacterium]
MSYHVTGCTIAPPFTNTPWAGMTQDEADTFNASGNGWEQVTGRRMAATKKFFTGGVMPTSLSRQNMDRYYIRGVTVWACMTPAWDPPTRPSRAALDSTLAMWAAAGYTENVIVVLWQEPMNTMPPSQWAAVMAYYGPTVKARGFALGASLSRSGPGHASYPSAAMALDALFSETSIVPDIMGLDYYANGNGWPAHTPDRVASRADAHGIPFGLTEFNQQTASRADATAYLNYIKTYFDDRAAAGKPPAAMIWYAGYPRGHGDITDPADYRVPLYQVLADAYEPSQPRRPPR